VTIESKLHSAIEMIKNRVNGAISQMKSEINGVNSRLNIRIEEVAKENKEVEKDLTHLILRVKSETQALVNKQISAME
jgi:hypothetical protein